MLNNIYSSLSGALAQEKVLEVIANNLANVNTAGFKGEVVTFKLLEAEPYLNYKEPLPPANFKQDMTDVFPLHGNEMNYVGISGVETDYTQGSPQETKNPLDLMIEGDGFFTVQTPEGERYTRAGSMTLNSDGLLVDKLGHPILGQKGTIALKDGNLEVNPLGEVSVNGALMDKILIKRFEDTKQLQKIGDNLFNFIGDPAQVSVPDYPILRQGYVESSNVNPIKNLTQMIVAHRSYEAYQKAIKSVDEIMDRQSNKLAEVRG